MTFSALDLEWMRLAIEASAKAVRAGDMPFGAALAKGDALLHVAGNDQNTARDLTGHAEVALLRQAAARHGKGALAGATVYASGEPCAMCTGALFWAGVARVVFAASTPDIIAILGGAALPIGTAEVLVGASPAVRVEGPLLRDEAVAVLRAFAAGEGGER